MKHGMMKKMNDTKANVNKVVTIYPKDSAEKVVMGIEESKLLYSKIDVKNKK